MIGGAHNQCVAWQSVHLHKEGGHNSLDLSGLLSVAALFANRIELVKE